MQSLVMDDFTDDDNGVDDGVACEDGKAKTSLSDVEIDYETRSEISDEEEEITVKKEQDFTENQSSDQRGKSLKAEPKEEPCTEPSKAQDFAEYSDIDLVKSNFQDSKFFLVRAHDPYNIMVSQDNGVWFTDANIVRQLDETVRVVKNVVLIICVKWTGRFFGFATVDGECITSYPPADWEVPSFVTSGGVFNIKWICQRELHFQYTKHLINVNTGTPVSESTDGQEIDQDVGTQLCKMIMTQGKKISIEKLLVDTTIRRNIQDAEDDDLLEKDRKRSTSRTKIEEARTTSSKAKRSKTRSSSHHSSRSRASKDKSSSSKDKITVTSEIDGEVKTPKPQIMSRSHVSQRQTSKTISGHRSRSPLKISQLPIRQERIRKEISSSSHHHPQSSHIPLQKFEISPERYRSRRIGANHRSPSPVRRLQMSPERHGSRGTGRSRHDHHPRFSTRKLWISPERPRSRESGRSNSYRRSRSPIQQYRAHYHLHSPSQSPHSSDHLSRELSVELERSLNQSFSSYSPQRRSLSRGGYDSASEFRPDTLPDRRRSEEEYIHGSNFHRISPVRRSDSSQDRYLPSESNYREKFSITPDTYRSSEPDIQYFKSSTTVRSPVRIPSISPEKYASRGPHTQDSKYFQQSPRRPDIEHRRFSSRQKLQEHKEYDLRHKSPFQTSTKILYTKRPLGVGTNDVVKSSNSVSTNSRFLDKDARTQGSGFSKRSSNKISEVEVDRHRYPTYGTNDDESDWHPQSVRTTSDHRLRSPKRPSQVKQEVLSILQLGSAFYNGRPLPQYDLLQDSRDLTHSIRDKREPPRTTRVFKEETQRGLAPPSEYPAIKLQNDHDSYALMTDESNDTASNDTDQTPTYDERCPNQVEQPRKRRNNQERDQQSPVQDHRRNSGHDALDLIDEMHRDFIRSKKSAAARRESTINPVSLRANIESSSSRHARANSRERRLDRLVRQHYRKDVKSISSHGKSPSHFSKFERTPHEVIERSKNLTFGRVESYPQAASIGRNKIDEQQLLARPSSLLDQKPVATTLPIVFDQPPPALLSSLGGVFPQPLEPADNVTPRIFARTYDSQDVAHHPPPVNSTPAQQLQTNWVDGPLIPFNTSTSISYPHPQAVPPVSHPPQLQQWNQQHHISGDQRRDRNRINNVGSQGINSWNGRKLLKPRREPQLRQITRLS